jgi:hypothetical protein
MRPRMQVDRTREHRGIEIKKKAQSTEQPKNAAFVYRHPAVFPSVP